MKLHETDNRGGIAVKTYTTTLQCELQRIYSASYSVSTVRVSVYLQCQFQCIYSASYSVSTVRVSVYLQCEFQCIYSASFSVSTVRVTVYDLQCELKEEFL